MAGLPNPPGFGDNSWYEEEWAKAMKAVAAPHAVEDSAAWTASVGVGTRTVDVAAGAGWACGVWDRTDAVETLTFDPNATGSDRNDALVARFDWTTGLRTFAVIPGTTVPPDIVDTGSVVDPAKINRLPGIQYDALLHVVKVRPGVTSFLGTDLFDCRVWGGQSGLMVTATGARMPWRDAELGAQLIQADNGKTWIRREAAWEEFTLPTDSGWVDVPIAGGFAPWSESPQVRLINGVVQARGGWANTNMAQGNTYVVGTIPDGYRPDRIMRLRCSLSSVTTEGRIVIFPSGSVQVDTHPTLGLSQYFGIDGLSWPPA